jgi:hypothetical protein
MDSLAPERGLKFRWRFLVAIVALIGLIISLLFLREASREPSPSVSASPPGQAIPEASRTPVDAAPAAPPVAAESTRGANAVSKAPPSRASTPASRDCSAPAVADRPVSCLFRKDHHDSGLVSSDRTSANASDTGIATPDLRTYELAAVRAVSERLDALILGSVGISAPDVVAEYEPFPLVLRLSAHSVETVVESLHRDFPQNKTVVGGGVKIASRMSAQVHGPDLEVIPADAISQAISLNEPTTWRWRAKANRAGVVPITFTVVATPVIDGTTYQRNYYFERAIRVKVEPAAFVRQHWEWFASSIFIPVAIAGMAWFKRQHSRKEDRPKKIRRRRPFL